jgi:hypothetical protein
MTEKSKKQEGLEASDIFRISWDSVSNLPGTQVKGWYFF